jgi:cell division protein FtsN
MEQKSVLWTIFSVIAFLVVVVVLGLIFFYPKKEAASSGLTVNGVAVQPADSVNPEAWIRQPSTVPGFETPEEAPVTESSPTASYGEPPAASSTAGLSDTGDAITIDMREAPAFGETAKSENRASDAAALPRPAPAAASAKSSPKATNKPAAAAPAVARYWIQAGSFKSRSNAEQTKAALDKKGLSSLVTTKNENGDDFYRVRVGPFATGAEAEAWLQKVRAVDGFSGSYVSRVGPAN